MEFSLFMIKPIAYKYKDEILKIISEKLKIESTTDVILSKEFLEKLYIGENETFKKLSIAYLANKRVCVGVVSGENARAKLIEICGAHFIPEKCDKNSIRYKYRTKQQSITFNGQTFYINSIHKSSPQDANYEVGLYIDEFRKKKVKKERAEDEEER